jgi:hypothetical protein
MKFGVLVLVAVVGCASSRARGGDDDVDADDVDAEGGEVDAPALDAATDASPDAALPPSNAAPLLLTELSLAPNGGELIEILNPTAGTVTLTNYYLSDVPTYFRPPAGQTVVSGDFIVRFPPAPPSPPAASSPSPSTPRPTSPPPPAWRPPTHRRRHHDHQTISGAATSDQRQRAGHPVLLGRRQRPVVDVD